MTTPDVWLVEGDTPDDDLVVMVGPLAARLGPTMRRLAREARRDGLTIDGAIAHLLAVFEQAERRWPAPADPRFRRLAPAGFDLSGWQYGTDMVTSSCPEVARRVGITEQAVRRAAREGRLAGHQGPDGIWRFTEQAIEQFEQNRSQPA